MALERRDPIPPGIYWIDAIRRTPRGDAEEAFRRWRADHADRVIVRATEDHGEYVWILFEVLADVPRWSGDTGLGLPSRAPRGAATRREDTVQRPPPEKMPGLSDVVASAIVPAVLVLAALVLLRR